MTVRFHIRIFGQVQNVFFRKSAKIEADKLGILGWVKNLEDGSVEAIAQGPDEAVEKFIAWCKKGPPFAKVENVEIEQMEGYEGLEEFSIHG